MLHIMGNEEGKFPAEGGYLAINQEIANVCIRLEYKWGVKRHAPRYAPKRDNGLLYGPHVAPECRLPEPRWAPAVHKALPAPVRPRGEVRRRPRNRPSAASSRMATSSCWISGIRSRSSGRAIARRTSSTAAP